MKSLGGPITTLFLLRDLRVGQILEETGFLVKANDMAADYYYLIRSAFSSSQDQGGQRVRLMISRPAMKNIHSGAAGEI